MLHQPSHIKDVGGYIFFSKNTKGLSGRPIKIHTSLFVDFYCAVDPNTQSGQVIIREIENLKTFARANTAPPPPSHPRDSPRHIEQLAKIRNNLKIMTGRQEQSFITKNLRVYYYIHQKQGDKYPTVYISELQVIAGGLDGQGGMYDLRGIGRIKSLSKVDNLNLDKRTVFISGATTDREDALKEGRYCTGRTDPAVFFCPLHVAEDLGIGKPKRLTTPTKRLVEELQKTVKANQNKQVDWMVQGEGAAVLSKALEGVPGNLEKHSFKFDNARANLPPLIKALNQKKAKLEGEFINYFCDRAALLAIATQKQALMSQLMDVPVKPGYEKITRRHLLKQIDDLGRGDPAAKQHQSLRGDGITFVDALLKTQGK